jgi:hypothetical protein
MQPDYDIRIRSMSKALADTILPAIDPSNQAALEQAHIVLGSLEILRQQINFVHPFVVADIRSLASLTRLVATEVGGHHAKASDRTIAAALTTAECPDSSISSLQSANGTLRTLLSDLIEQGYATGDDDMIRRLQDLVIANSRDQIARERAFVAGAGFDVFPETLVTIETALQSG